MTFTVAVIGGGISGLAAAYYLGQAGAAVTVFEKTPRIGGHLRVSELAGVPVDEGAESLLNRRPEAVTLAREVGLSDDIVYPAPAGAAIWSRGRMHSLPTGTVMGVPPDPGTLEGLLTSQEIERVRAEAGRPGMPLSGDTGIGRLVTERLGSAVTERLVEPLLAGVYAGRADNLSLRATVPALAAAAQRETSLLDAAAAVIAQSRRDQGSLPVFAGIRGGVGRLAGAVAGASGAEIRTGVTVRAIQQGSDGRFCVETGPVPRPEFVDVDGVVVAVPPVAAARLVRDVAPVAGSVLAGVEQASVAIVALAFRRSAFPVPPTSSGFLVPPAEGLTIKAVTFSSVKWPWLGEMADDRLVLRASVGRIGDVADLQRPDDELVGAVLRDLEQVLGVRGAPVDSRVTRWGGALPQYAVGHAERMQAVQDAIRAVPGLAVCGAVYDGVGIAACVAGARLAAGQITTGLGSVV